MGNNGGLIAEAMGVHSCNSSVGWQLPRVACGRVQFERISHIMVQLGQCIIVMDSSCSIEAFRVTNGHDIDTLSSRAQVNC